MSRFCSWIPWGLLTLMLGCQTAPPRPVPTRPGSLAADVPMFRPGAAPERPSTNPTGSVSFAGALALAMRQNPSLRAAVWAERARQGSVLQAGLLPNPELQVEVEEFAGSGELREFDAAEVSIGVSQLFELAGKRSSRERVAALEREASSWQVELQRRSLWESTATQFIAVLAQQHRLALAERSLELSERVLATVRERVAAGKVAALEQTRAEVDRASQTLAVSRERAGLQRARLQLVSSWGGDAALFEQALPQASDSLLVQLPELETLAAHLAEHPLLRRWEAEIAALRARIELEEALAYPDLTVGAGVSYFAESEDIALHAGLSIPLPLFNRNQGAIMQAQAELQAAEEERRAAALRLYRSLEDAAFDLGTRIDEVRTLRETLLPAAERAYATSQTGYVDGKFSYLDVLDAQRTLFDAQARAIDALEGYQTALATCEALLGRSLRSTAPGGQ